MFRRAILPCACPVAALLVAALGLGLVALPPAPALGQERSTDQRIDRLERDLSMLQRQVYRGLPPSAATASPSAAVNLEVRMGRLESQMRDLTGRVEEVSNQLSRLRQRIEQVNSDVEQRFSQSGNAQAGDGSSADGGGQLATGRLRRPPPYPPLSGDGDELAPPGAEPPRGSPMPGRLAAHDEDAPGDARGGPVFGVLTPPGAAAPAGETRHDSGRPSAKDVLPSGSAAAQYNYAFGLLQRADYPAAAAALKAFLARHPKDRLAGNAQYWLGETYYTRHRYLEAASAFAEGYKRYPKSPKAADNLLKLGMALARANQKKNACLAFAQLERDYPHAGISVRRHATAEKKRLGC